MAERRPDRSMNRHATRFWEFTKARELRLQRCDDCARFRWPPSSICDDCLSEAFTWKPVSGRGKVVSWATFRRQYFSEYPPGHTVVSLELEEGPLFISIPREVDNRDLVDGMEMELVWEESVDGFGEYNLPVFRPTVPVSRSAERI